MSRVRSRLAGYSTLTFSYIEVVEDARQTFASTSKQSPLPPLPLAPLSRSSSQNRGNRSSRLPRKVLAANQIFADESEQSPAEQTMSSFVTSIYATPTTDASVVAATQVIPEIRTPSKQRRATVSAGYCEPTGMAGETEMDPLSKSRSHGNLLQLRIKPLSKLELDLEKSKGHLIHDWFASFSGVQVDRHQRHLPVCRLL